LTFLGFQRPPTIWSTTSTPCAVGKLTTGLVNICEPCPLRSYWIKLKYQKARTCWFGKLEFKLAIYFWFSMTPLSQLL
jgi:hypothetical protein